MSTPVVMPQMGESIAEGTIVRWIKKVGDAVDRDEPLFEISTDKVDAEIPSPTAGVLIDIAVKEGETVPINSVVATIGAAGEKVAAAPASASAPAAAATSSSAMPEAAVGQPEVPAASAAAAEPAAPVDCGSCRCPGNRRAGDRCRATAAASARRRSCAASPRSTTSTSPASHGSGIGGRVTKHDILEFIDKGPATGAESAPAPAAATAGPSVSGSAPSAVAAKPAAPPPWPVWPATGSSRCR